MVVCVRYVRHLGAPRAGHRSTPPAEHLRGRGVRGVAVPGRTGCLPSTFMQGASSTWPAKTLITILSVLKGRKMEQSCRPHLHGHACVERRHEEVRDAGDHDGECCACDHARKRTRARAAAHVLIERGGNDERTGREHAHGCAERVEEDARHPRDDGDRSAQLGPEGERHDEADDTRGIVREPRRHQEDGNLHEAQHERRGGEKGRECDLLYRRVWWMSCSWQSPPFLPSGLYRRPWNLTRSAACAGQRLLARSALCSRAVRPASRRPASYRR